MNKLSIIIPVLYALQLGTTCVQALTLDIQGDQLMGASGVDVNGKLYDVLFADGSCNSQYDNCDRNRFLFTDYASAIDAGQALLDQVFVNGTRGDFDTNPSLTNGCDALDWCYIFSPMFYDELNDLVYYSAVWNSNDKAAPDVVLAYPDIHYTTTADHNSEYEFQASRAVWSLHKSDEPAPEPVPVPEPGSIVLLGLGLTGLGVTRRRRHLLLITSK